MADVAEKSKTAELAGLVYKNMKMGSESVIGLLPKVEDEDMRSRMTEQLDGYEKFATRASELLRAEGEQPQEENMMAKMGAKMGMSFKTMVDSTSSHIAEMMMQGSLMGVCETTRNVRRFEGEGCDDKVIKLCYDIIEFEKSNMKKAEQYL